jgi:hypothetical protein
MPAILRSSAQRPFSHAIGTGSGRNLAASYLTFVFIGTVAEARHLLAVEPIK